MRPEEVPALEGEIDRELRNAARFTEEFHMGESRVHDALLELVRLLDRLQIPYAIVGALALNAYGYRRATVDIDLLLNQEGLDRLKTASLGRGYLEKFPGSRGLRDTIRGVEIDVLLAGDYPGDGTPKPVRFPDPAHATLRGRAFRLVPIETLVELKLASGMTAPHRLRDLADVIELIRVNSLPEAFAEKLDPYVRERFAELWRAAQTDDRR